MNSPILTALTRALNAVSAKQLESTTTDELVALHNAAREVAALAEKRLRERKQGEAA